MIRKFIYKATKRSIFVGWWSAVAAAILIYFFYHGVFPENET